MTEITLKSNRIRCSLKRREVRRVMEALFRKTPTTKTKSKKKTTKKRPAKNAA